MTTSSSTQNYTPVLHHSQLEEIGGGLNSVVFKLRDRKTVVKTPRVGFKLHHEVERSIYQRFEQRSGHASVLRYFGETQIEGYSATGPALGLLFEHHPEGILREVLKKSVAPPQDGQKLQLCKNIASAIAFVHSCNIIHGDIGIHNILFSQEPQPRLILADFGGSRIDGSQFLSWPSARYRMEGREYRQSEPYEPTEQHDTFALGVVLYEILTWAQLWRNKEHPEVLALIREERFPDLELVPLAVLRKVIGRCWQRQYLTGSDVFSDLEELSPSC